MSPQRTDQDPEGADGMTAPMAAPAAARMAARTVACPSCQGPALYAESNPWRPFCSARCRGVDLGAWANEQFRVPAEAPTEDDLGPPGH